ncbi:hypothetical protein MP228_011043 [Amoeboaphelidium protococcarum]|nr:hypothetical protein MP228_011043 [Amoeboaphelidium protococcarum]
MSYSSTNQKKMKQYGITPPMSLEMPTEYELAQTAALKQFLTEMNVFEPEEESQKRVQVLQKLDSMVKEFVITVAYKNNLPDAVAMEAGGKIFTFGSYRLGVHGTGADIDTLCVVPRFVQREDFFTLFHETLLNTPEVKEVTAVPDSYVPVIKMEFDGIPIDLLFARLNLMSIKQDLELRADSLLKNLDEREVRSLNGSRVTDEILRLVPDVENFRLTLRCIKLWAQKRAVYGNVMGFPGGVAWALCVGRVCQLYPNATASVLVAKFFKIMSSWSWPQPVMLKNIEEGQLHLKVWNPMVYPQDRVHRMPIITPAYPSMCATHNVTDSTLKIIIDELSLGAKIVEQILKEPKVKSVNSGDEQLTAGDDNSEEEDGSDVVEWKSLFTKHNFFFRYKFYIQVIASSYLIDSQRLWSSLVESRLRHLVLKLEVTEGVSIAHPFVKGFEKSIQFRTNKEAMEAGRGLFSQQKKQEEDDSTHAQLSTHSDQQQQQQAGDEQSDEHKTIHTSTFYIGISTEKKSNQQSAGDGSSNNNNKKLDLSWPVNEFTKMCQSWEKFDEKTMGICLKIVRNSYLPDDVFEPGEREQKKLLKRSKGRKGATGDGEHDKDQKRSKQLAGDQQQDQDQQLQQQEQLHQLYQIETIDH